MFMKNQKQVHYDHVKELAVFCNVSPCGIAVGGRGGGYANT